MSQDLDIVVNAQRVIQVETRTMQNLLVETETTPDLLVVLAGNIGPPGPAGKWKAMTQSEYDLLNPPDPDTLYIIIQ